MATSATTTAKESWKPGSFTAWGATAMIATAASATNRMEIARRPIATATSTMVVTTKARWADTVAPLSSR